MGKFTRLLAKGVFSIAPRFFVRALFGDIWRMRDVIRARRRRGRCRGGRWLSLLADEYWASFGSWVGVNAVFEGPSTFPHGPVGFFVSNNAHIGRNCVIFQQVTIGSNNLKDSRRKGSPYLEDNVYVGCGAKIIGDVHVGRNARIGANCVVVKDVPANSVTVIRGVESFVKDGELDNEFVPTL